MPRQIMPDSLLLTPSLAAKYLGLGEEHARRLMNENEIPSVDVYQNGRDIRTTREKCEIWLQNIFENPNFSPPLAAQRGEKNSFENVVNAENRAKVGRHAHGSRKTATHHDLDSLKNRKSNRRGGQ